MFSGMLKACLESLLKQNLPDELSMFLVVVENDQLPRSAALVNHLNSSKQHPHSHVHEAQLGIPIARNRAVSTALQYRPDWIGFIDDDEIADCDWVAKFVAAAATFSCDVHRTV